MKRGVFHFLFLLVLASISIVFTSSVTSSQVLINEVLADPARDWNNDGSVSYRDDEWVEIINTGASVVSLDSMFLADGDAEITIRLGFSGELAPHGVLVVFGSDAVAWQEANGSPSYGLSLNNSGDKISLVRISQGDTIVVDSLKFSNETAEDDRSVGRNANEAGQWILFDAYNPCSRNCEFEPSGCIPTPGSSNTCITATDNSSWGAIKSLYKN